MLTFVLKCVFNNYVVFCSEFHYSKKHRTVSLKLIFETCALTLFIESWFCRLFSTFNLNLCFLNLFFRFILNYIFKLCFEFDAWFLFLNLFWITVWNVVSKLWLNFMLKYISNFVFKLFFKFTSGIREISF